MRMRTVFSLIFLRLRGRQRRQHQHSDQRQRHGPGAQQRMDTTHSSQAPHNGSGSSPRAGSPTPLHSLKRPSPATAVLPVPHFAGVVPPETRHNHDASFVRFSRRSSAPVKAWRQCHEAFGLPARLKSARPNIVRTIARDHDATVAGGMERSPGVRARAPGARKSRAIPVWSPVRIAAKRHAGL